MLVLLITVALGGHFVIENPGSSLIWLHDRFQWMLGALEAIGNKAPLWEFQSKPDHLKTCFSHPRKKLDPFHQTLRPAQVYRQSFWMRFWGHPTMKRTNLWSTSKVIGTFNRGKLSSKKKPSKVKTVVKYKNKRGQVAYKGSKHLKSTQMLISIESRGFDDSWKVPKSSIVNQFGI